MLINTYVKKEVKEVETSIHFRCNQELKSKLQRAAEESNETVSEYCVRNLAAIVENPNDKTKYKKREPGRKDEELKMRIAAVDKKAIKERAKEANLSVGEYVIRASLEQQTVVIIDGKDILHQLSKIGTNLNQLTILAHQGKIQCPELGNVNQVLSKILEQMQKLLRGG